jgi:hypothetical protein
MALPKHFLPARFPGFAWSHSPNRWRAALAAALLLWLCPRDTRAQGQLGYKFQTWQEESGRIRVDSHYALAERDLGVATKLKVTGLVDTISGASPTGQPASKPGAPLPVASLTDRRKAWSLDLSHVLSVTTVALGYANSRESDYISDGWWVNSRTEFNEKNTTLLVGYARVDDDITARFLPAPQTKTGDDVVVGVTQLLNPRTSLSVNVTRGVSRGYLSDPYKIIQKSTELLPGLSLPLTFPENRPNRREKWIVFSGLNLALPEMNGALDGSYRFYRDDYGTRSHTFELAWFQSLGERLIVRPAVRYYRQGAADFYRLSLDGSAIVPGSFTTGRAPFFSADYRLSEMDTSTVGVKVIWTVRPERLTIDAALERYTMRGRDGKTPVDAYADANVLTVGANFSW